MRKLRPREVMPRVTHSVLSSVGSTAGTGLWLPASSAPTPYYKQVSVQFSSVTQSCPTLCDPMNRSMPGLPVHHQLLEFTQTHVHESVMPSNHFILCCPLLLLPSIFPSIRVFSNELALHIRLPEFWFQNAQHHFCGSEFPVNLRVGKKTTRKLQL